MLRINNRCYHTSSKRNHEVAVLFIILIVVLFFQAGCSKDYLDVKPDKKLVLPSTLQDLQALMDNTTYMNNGWPSAGEIAADNYYVTSNAWNAFSYDVTSQNLYIWEDNVFNDNTNNEWFLAYQAAFYANTVLANIDQVQADSVSDKEQKNNIKGEALFFRAQAFYELAQIFCKPYITTTASTDAGIPLRLTPDINQPTVRATVESTYQQVIDDLKNAASLLMVHPLYKTRPSKPAAYGLLARAFLSMQDYEEAKLYADSCLRLYNTLIDYNVLDTTSYNPFPMFSDEVIFHSGMLPRSIVLPSAAIVDTVLYQSYTGDDLRKGVFFKPLDVNAYNFYGSYSGTYVLFNGIATDEMYLVQAECLARSNKISEAMEALNTLLLKRWKAGTFIPYTASNADEALAKILRERQKELVFRGLRWTDLRRLNQDTKYAKTITRIINGQSYTLQPNDLKYVLLIPEQVINISNIEQNPR